jgi:hypothetical protein
MAPTCGCCILPSIARKWVLLEAFIAPSPVTGASHSSVVCLAIDSAWFLWTVGLMLGPREIPCGCR